MLVVLSCDAFRSYGCNHSSHNPHVDAGIVLNMFQPHQLYPVSITAYLQLTRLACEVTRLQDSEPWQASRSARPSARTSILETARPSANQQEVSRGTRQSIKFNWFYAYGGLHTGGTNSQECTLLDRPLLIPDDLLLQQRRLDFHCMPGKCLY